jgi:hypothetical protein
MAILPEERRENVKASLFTYLSDNFTLVPIYYGIAGIKEEDVDEWVRVDVMFPTPTYRRQVGLGQMGAEAIIMLNMNIFKKQTEAESVNIYRSDRIVDTLSNLFRVPLGIPVKDYVESNGAGTNNLSTLQTSVLDTDDLGWQERLALYQYNVTSHMRYVMKWEQPS